MLTARAMKNIKVSHNRQRLRKTNTVEMSQTDTPAEVEQSVLAEQSSSLAYKTFSVADSVLDEQSSSLADQTSAVTESVPDEQSSSLADQTFSVAELIPGNQTYSVTELMPTGQSSSQAEVGVAGQTAYEWMMQCPEEYEYECSISSDFKIDELNLHVPYFSPPWFVKAKLAHFSSSSLLCRELLAKIEATDTNNLARKFDKCRVDQTLTF